MPIWPYAFVWAGLIQCKSHLSDAGGWSQQGPQLGRHDGSEVWENNNHVLDMLLALVIINIWLRTPIFILTQHSIPLCHPYLDHQYIGSLSYLYVHYFEALSSLIALTSFYMFMISVFISLKCRFRCPGFECLLSRSNLLCQTEFLIFPFFLHNPTSFTIFDISVNGTSILLAAKIKNTESSLILSYLFTIISKGKLSCPYFEIISHFQWHLFSTPRKAFFFWLEFFHPFNPFLSILRMRQSIKKYSTKILARSCQSSWKSSMISDITQRVKLKSLKCLRVSVWSDTVSSPTLFPIHFPLIELLNRASQPQCPPFGVLFRVVGKLKSICPRFSRVWHVNVPPIKCTCE